MPIDHSDPIYILRQELAAEITRSLGGADSQFVIAPYYGIPQPRMSELARGLVERCSIEWLIRRIHRMGGLSRSVSRLVMRVGPGGRRSEGSASLALSKE